MDFSSPEPIVGQVPADAILDRIRKLLRLGHPTSGATEAEATAALAKANELLLRYNLSADSLASERRDDRPARIEEDAIRLGRREGWQHRLLISLARHNWCYPFFNGSDVVFVGRPTNVAATREMFNWLAPQLERLCDEEWAAFSHNSENLLRTYDSSWCPECEVGCYRDPGRHCMDCGTVLQSPRIHGRTWKTSFYAGMLWRVTERLYKERKQLEQATERAEPQSQPVDGSPMALAIRNLQLATRHENETYIERHHGKLTNKRNSGRGNGDSGAYRRGRQAGDRVSLRGHKLGGSDRRQLAGGQQS